MTFDQIIADIENKIYRPVYFLSGDEPYYIDEISDQIEEKVLNETEKEFNQTVVYGRDVDMETIISNAKRFPMMANYQVVIVREAQDIKDIRRSPAVLEKLDAYIKNPLKSTILVFCYKYHKVDKRKAVFKNIQKNGVLFASTKLYDDKVPAWITNYCRKNNYSITPKAGYLLSEYIGSNIGKLVNELSKIMINLPKGSTIDEDAIQDNIGISKDYNIFELQSAFGTKDVVKSNRIINNFAANPKDNPFVRTIASLFGYFNKILMYHGIKDKSQKNVASVLSIHPFFVKEYTTAARNYSREKVERIMSYLRTYDMKFKGVGNASTTEGELLKELTYLILH
jgi:DNA polymerase-3 subunit delta